jgi:hypothetical protein
LAPEQVSGAACTPATDVFALGQVAVYAATGAPAFGGGSSEAVLYRIVHEDPALFDLPEELRELATRCLARDPGDRPSPAEVIELCRGVSPRTELRGLYDWLPAAQAVDIDRHSQAPTVWPFDQRNEVGSALADPLIVQTAGGEIPRPRNAPESKTAQRTGGLYRRHLYVVGLLAVLFGIVLAAPRGAWWGTALLAVLWVLLAATAVVTARRGPAAYEAVGTVGRKPAVGRSGPRRGAAFLDGLTDAAAFLRPRTAAPPEPGARDSYLHEAYNRLGPPPPDGARTAGGGGR